ncbi:MAG: PAS domain S-box protein [Proteobacteria bacterium]|nr:PAS domain S-box protein [Pseudomonadota bacterium]MBU1739016.1 PAS domain S-box protein [Pseudomonadota bacterium]
MTSDTTSTSKEPAERFAELEKQERLLRLVSDNSPAYNAYVGIHDLRYKFVNKRYIEGFNRPREEIIGKHIKEIIGEANYEFALESINTVRNGQATSYVNTFNLKEGKRWIKVNFSPDFNTRGEVVGIVVLSYDITEQKQAEESLQKSETLYHDLVETSQDLIWQCDAEGRYIYLNPAWETTFGYQITEMLGKKFTDFQSPEQAKKDHAEFLRLKQGNSVKGFETVHLGKDGREIHLVFNAKFLTDETGDIVGTRGTAYDITDRYLAGKQLSESEEKYRDLVENTEDLITHTDQDGRFTFVNHTSRKIFGISPEECVGLRALDFIHPDDRERTRNQLSDCVAGKRLKDSIENRQVNRITGESHTLLWSTSFTYDDSGSLVGIGGIARDVTPIRTAEQNYANLFAKMLDGFALHEIICDDAGRPVDYRFLSVNPAFEKLTGLIAEKLIGKTVLEVMPGTEKHWIDTYGKVAITGEPVLFENYSAELDKFFEISAYRPSEGQFACIFQDISSRKKAENALQERTNFLDKIIESAALSMWISDAEGTVIRANSACLDFFGATEDEVVGKYNLFKDIVIEKQGFMPVIRDVFAKKEPASIILDYDFGAVDHVEVKNATHKIIESVFTPVLDHNGDVSNIIVQAIDLTDIKKQEEALRKSEERYRLLYTNTPSMLHSIDQNGQLIDVSDTWLNKLGYLKEEVIGRKSSDFLTEDSRRYASETVLPEFFKTGSCTDISYTFVKKNGEEMDVLLSATAEKDTEGNIIRSLAVLEDVTEKIRLEAQLRHTQKMEAIGTLSGGIAHDFNNILSAVLGYAEIARDEIPDWNPAKHQIDEVLKAANRAKDLVKQILSFSRKGEQNRKPVKIQLLIEETLNFLRASIPTTIDIRLNMAPDCGAILADPTQIHQVLMNLCTNAAQAMEEDGGVLRIDLYEIELNGSGSGNDLNLKPGVYILLSIADTGVGISQKHLERIFDPYFTTKEVGKGSGMGLAVVHGIVLSHDGRITVESSAGQGSTFKLYFPRVAVEPEKQENVDTSPLPGGKENILIVDDDASIARLTQKRLEMLGYQPTAMTSSTEALELFRAAPHTYALVITDQTMPMLTGEQLAKELLKIRPDIPIIMSTGYSSKIDADKANLMGIRAFIMKPVDHKDLATTIRAVLNGN